MRPDPRIAGAAKHMRARGLYAEVVQITSVLYWHGKIVMRHDNGRRKEHACNNPALLNRLEHQLGRSGALPAWAAVWAVSREDFSAGRYGVWLASDGEVEASDGTIRGRARVPDQPED